MNAERPNVLPWPPMIYGGTAVLGLLLHTKLWWPLPEAGFLPGLVLLVAGLALDVWAMATMHRAKTNILPHRAADSLVDTGPFSHMRNPIYVGNSIALFGLGLVLSIGWLCLMAPVAAILTHHLAVVREEAHLQAKFGKAWSEYAGRVKRWWVF